MYPELEDGDAELRAAPIEWLGNYLEPEKGSSPALAIQFVGLNARASITSNTKKPRRMGYEEAVKANELRRKAREAAIKEGKIPPEAFDKAAAARLPRNWSESWKRT